MSLSKTLYLLLSTGSIQENRRSLQHDMTIIIDHKKQRCHGDDVQYGTMYI